MKAPSEARRLCVFGGSRSGHDPRFIAAAHSLGRHIAEQGLELVYGGGCTGMMGAVAAGSLEVGGTVIGVVPRDLFDDDQLHHGLSRLITTSGMHERKLRMTELATAFAVLPGGYGTLEETFEALTWQQLGLHRKPLGLLDIGGFFEPFWALVEQLSRAGFLGPNCPRPLREEDPGVLVSRLFEHAPPTALAPWARVKATSSP